VSGKIVLLIDDVMTTGSTLNRCAEVLLDENPLGIYALTFCRALG
jgi:predicted amidophosphoribosyltransferase